MKELEQENAQLKCLVANLAWIISCRRILLQEMYGPLRFCKRRGSSDTGRFA